MSLLWVKDLCTSNNDIEFAKNKQLHMLCIPPWEYVVNGGVSVDVHIVVP